jgi:hypothetical protein
MRQDEYGTFAFLLSIEQGESTFVFDRRVLKMVFVAIMAFMAIADAYIAAGHHGGDGVFIDHLAHLIAQQYHELIEGFDRALQLNAIDQVDGDRYALTAQCV